VVRLPYFFCCCAPPRHTGSFWFCYCLVSALPLCANTTAVNATSAVCTFLFLHLDCRRLPAARSAPPLLRSFCLPFLVLRIFLPPTVWFCRSAACRSTYGRFCRTAAARTRRGFCGFCLDNLSTAVLRRGRGSPFLPPVLLPPPAACLLPAAKHLDQIGLTGFLTCLPATCYPAACRSAVRANHCLLLPWVLRLHIPRFCTPWTP